MKVHNGATGGVSLLALHPNVKKYLLLRVLMSTHGLFLVAVPSLWNDVVMGVREIAMLEAGYSVVVIPLALAGGAFADLKGRRLSMLIGAALLMVGMALYAQAGCLTAVYAAEFVLGAAWAVLNSADGALLADSVAERVKDEAKCKQYVERIKRISLLISLSGMAVSTYVGGVIAEQNPRLAIWASVVPMAAVLIVLAWMAEPVRSIVSTKCGVFIAMSNLRKMVCRELTTNAELRRLNILHAVLACCSVVSFLYLQAFCNERGYGASVFGLVFGLNSLVAAGSGLIVTSLERRFGMPMVEKLALAIAFLPMLAAGATSSPIVIALFVLHGFLRAFTEVSIGVRVIMSAKGQDRATISSVMQMTFRSLVVVVCLILAVMPITIDVASLFAVTVALNLLVMFSFRLHKMELAR